MAEVSKEKKRPAPVMKCASTSEDPEIKCISCCKLEALVTVDERGQMILPKEIREKAEIKAGDKLVVVTSEKDGKVCCISLLKADELKESIRKSFGPLLEELFR